MASLISSFYSRSNWHALGISILPIVADQLVQRVFSKKCSPLNLETASLITGTITYVLLSRELPSHFKLGAPILYLAYKAAQSYLSWQTRPDKDSKPSLRPPMSLLPTMPYHTDTRVPPVASVTKESEQKKESAESPAAVPVVAATSVPPTPLPVPTPAALTPAETAARKEAADRMNASIEAERMAIERFRNIIAPFEKSQIMSLKIQIKPLPNAAAVDGKKPVKAEMVKAQIRFGSTHVFRLGKTQVEALNKEGCTVTEKTLFFWIDIAGPDKKGASINFIPLVMLISLHPSASEFSLCLNEKDHQLILSFKEQQLARLKTLARAILACQNTVIIRNGIVDPFAATAASSGDSFGALLSNDMASINQSRCYLVPFMKKV